MSSQPTVEDYLLMLKDPQAQVQVRKQAIEKLGELGAKQAVEPLIQLINTYKVEENLKHQAMLAIGKIAGADNIPYFITRLIDTYRDTYWDFPSDLRLSETASKILVSLGELALQPLIEALQSTDNDTRGGAAYTLGQMKDKRAITPLIKVLFNDTEVSIRCQAAYSLGKIGGEEALPALEKASQTDFGENYTYDFVTSVSKCRIR
jgi:HEAT repeat protein